MKLGRQLHHSICHEVNRILTLYQILCTLLAQGGGFIMDWMKDNAEGEEEDEGKEADLDAELVVDEIWWFSSGEICFSFSSYSPYLWWPQLELIGRSEMFHLRFVQLPISHACQVPATGSLNSITWDSQAKWIVLYIESALSPFPEDIHWNGANVRKLCLRPFG